MGVFCTGPQFPHSDNSLDAVPLIGFLATFPSVALFSNSLMVLFAPPKQTTHSYCRFSFLGELKGRHMVNAFFSPMSLPYAAGTSSDGGMRGEGAIAQDT